MRRRAAALGGAAALIVAGVGGWVLWHRPAAPAAVQPVPDATPSTTADAVAGPGDVETVTTGAPDNGGTPMRDRVAVIGLLNKRDGASRDITMKPGQTLRVGDVVLRLRACEKTAPWEQQQLTGAFVQVDVRGVDTHWRRVFSGWLFKERPSLNVVTDPVYDVWTKSCAMTFPETGPGTTVVAAPHPRSSAKKSPDADDDAAPAAPAPAAPTTPDSADDSRAT
jgi:hypothetical protein